MNREYQHNFSSNSPGMYDVPGRTRKAKTMVAVIEDYVKQPLIDLSLLNIGGSAGIIDNYLSNYFKHVVSADIDKTAIEYAKTNFQKKNLNFQLGDACNLCFAENSFNVVICSQVYEHVPSPEKMMNEIFRCLVPGGICFFAANNRLTWNEPHYNLPLLSIIPRPLAHLYVRLAHKAEHYYEKHYSYWGLKRLVKKFIVHDYTTRVIRDPVKYGITYMVKPGSSKSSIARFISGNLLWLSPGYIWILEKPT